MRGRSSLAKGGGREVQELYLKLKLKVCCSYTKMNCLEKGRSRRKRGRRKIRRRRRRRSKRRRKRERNEDGGFC